jgi:hypothetical protein
MGVFYGYHLWYILRLIFRLAQVSLAPFYFYCLFHLAANLGAYPRHGVQQNRA